MKIVVAVASADALRQAGVRIRYKRMASEIAAAGHQLAVVTLAEVDKLAKPPTILLLSKCYDARSVLVARSLSMAGTIIGIDLFDDIFSYSDDSRFAVHRAWMRDIQPALDIILVSTDRMARIASAIAPGVAVHVMNDPACVVDLDRLAVRLAQKAAAARDQRVLDVAWFGIGDNPHFAVGLSDVAAYSYMLADLRSAGWEVRLRLLTNRRALSGDGLAFIHRIPFDVIPEEWSEAAEADLLESSLIAFLPVSAQPFSIAKSLNRAVTAFQHGTQILSAGYPLYQPFSSLVYRSTWELLEDLDRDTLRFRGETLGSFTDLVHSHADAAIEAGKLIEFFTLRNPGDHDPERSQILLFGTGMPAVIRDFADRHGALTAASPYVENVAQADIGFAVAAEQGIVKVALSPKACSYLAPQSFGRLSPLADMDGCRWLEVCVEQEIWDKIGLISADRDLATPLFYEQIMTALGALLASLFPGWCITASEDRPWLMPPPLRLRSGKTPQGKGVLLA